MSLTQSRVNTPKDFRGYLSAELLKRIQHNPNYSLCAFARSLKTDKSTLAKIMSGKRPLGKTAIARLGTRLQLPTQSIQAFIEQESAAKERSKKLKQLERYQQLQLDSFHVIADWYHYGILELMRLDHFKSDVNWVSHAIGIPSEEVEAAVARMSRLGMMEVTPTGKWVDLTDGRSTTIGLTFTDQALRKMQHQILTLAQQALENTPFEERSHSSMTFAADSSRMEEAKERITVFRRELARFLSRGEKRDRVYQLAVALFPVSSKSE